MPVPRTSIFLFSDTHWQACTCGRILGGSYVELDDDPPGTARRRMFELRRDLFSHEVNGPIRALIPEHVDDVDDIRRTHQRIPGNPPGGEACFCGGLGRDYRWARERGAQ